MIKEIPNHLKLALDIIKSNEGFSYKVYKDSLGIETIGYGRNIKTFPLSDLELEKIDSEKGYRKRDATLWTYDLIKQLDNSLNSKIWYNKQNDVRKAVILDMAYNLGLEKLFKFKKMILALNTEEFSNASSEMLESKWSFQVKKRAERLSKILLNGDEKTIKETYSFIDNEVEV